MSIGNIIIGQYESPCGIMTLGTFGDRLCLCDWQTGNRRYLIQNRLKQILKAEFAEGTSHVITTVTSQLDEFFAGNRVDFDFPLLFAGTEFQKQVWEALREIPFGQTVSYKQLAHNIGMPKAIRAVANANGSNPMSIIVPCHRVIGHNSTLTGYGGGLETKKYLLEHESYFLFRAPTSEK